MICESVFLKQIFIIVAFLFLFSYNREQTNDKNSNSHNRMKTGKFTNFEIETIPDIEKTDNKNSPEFIKKRIEQLIGKSFQKHCEEIGLTFPPKFILFRFFKLESEFEIWAGNSPEDSLKLLALLPVCAADKQPGTKLAEGDGRTPEGFYSVKILYGSELWFMWIILNSSQIDSYGQIKKGSSFRICLDYPLPIDRRRTAKFLSQQTSPGNGICIHGNCVTAGCISFLNRNFLPVFLAALYQNESKFGAVQIHIFPFRFSDKLISEYSQVDNSVMKTQDRIEFWKQLENGYNLFEKTHRAFRVKYSKDTYIFN
jgi:hypothetical protein